MKAPNYKGFIANGPVCFKVGWDFNFLLAIPFPYPADAFMAFL